MFGLNVTYDIAFLDGLKPTSLFRLAMKEYRAFANVKLNSFIPL